jgi:outer membrane protein OmpA-like peptidoglycan-associated protein
VKLLQKIILIWITALCSSAGAQHVTVINNYQGDTTKVEPGQFVLTGSTEHRYIINYYQPRNRNSNTRVLDLISFALAYYIDEMADMQSRTLTFRKPAQKNFEDLNEIVSNSLKLYEHPAAEAFWGFSGGLEKKLLELHQLKGRQIDYNDVENSGSSVKIGHYTLQKQMLELKMLAVREVEDLLEDTPAPIDSNGKLLSKNEQKTDSDNFRKNQPLDPIEFNAEEEYMQDLAMLDLVMPKEQKEPPKNQTADGDFNTRILNLLEENNRLMSGYNQRFDNMQSQIDELKQKPVVSSGNLPEGSEKRLQTQIEELRGMIKDLAETKSTPIDGSTTKPNSKLKPIEVIFERGSHEITVYNQTLLNEVVAELLKNKSHKIMITGFADRVGDRNLNAILSQKRAVAVRDYIAQRGIPQSRLVVNFYGDNKSKDLNPLDRKVEIEWLTDFTAVN